ncbi:hypothetical protein BC826DRAFT_680105 [Russula brevipes]|nr:hypothetical protein BC826DRAFT_680105 [Russula brevipes]
MGTPPTSSLNDKPKGGVAGGTEPLPGPLVEFLHDVIRSPDKHKEIVSNEKGSTDASGALKGLLPSSGHTKTTAMTSQQHNFPIAFRAVQSAGSSSDFSQISQSGGMLKQVNTTNPKLQSGIALPNSALSLPAAETSRSSSRSSRMDIPTQRPTETRTQTPLLGRNGRRTDGGAPGPPGGGPPGPPHGGDGSPGSHRDGTSGPAREHRPAATWTPTEAPRPPDLHPSRLRSRDWLPGPRSGDLVTETEGPENIALGPISRPVSGRQRIPQASPEIGTLRRLKDRLPITKLLGPHEGAVSESSRKDSEFSSVANTKVSSAGSHLRQSSIDGDVNVGLERGGAVVGINYKEEVDHQTVAHRDPDHGLGPDYVDPKPVVNQGGLRQRYQSSPVSGTATCWSSFRSFFSCRRWKSSPKQPETPRCS